MDNNKILEVAKQQIKEIVTGEYLNFTKEDISISVDNGNICFCIKEYVHKETLEGLKNAYVNNKKIAEKDAVILNIASILTTVDLALEEKTIAN